MQSPREPIKVIASKTSATKTSEDEPVRKKIRVVQYGVGPIGASIARLAREKAAIEIVARLTKIP